MKLVKMDETCIMRYDDTAAACRTMSATSGVVFGELVRLTAYIGAGTWYSRSFLSGGSLSHRQLLHLSKAAFVHCELVEWVKVAPGWKSASVYRTEFQVQEIQFFIHL